MQNDQHDIPVIELDDDIMPPSQPSRHTIVAATLAFCLAIGGAVALLTSNGDNAAPKASTLTPLQLATQSDASRSSQRDAGFGATASIFPGFDYRYVHTGVWPSLPSTATVYRLAAPAVSATDVARIAAALGLDAPVVTGKDGWSVTDGTSQLTVSRTDGAYSVSLYRNVAPDGASEPGSTGSGSTGSGTATTGAGAVDGQAPVPSNETTKVEAQTRPEILQPKAPEHLPTPQQATDIVKALIAKIGIEGSVEYEVLDGASTGVAVSCAPNANCAEPLVAPDATVFTRTVIVHRLVNGHRVDGLTWSYEIGDNGTIESAYGLLATAEPVNDYPLRAVDAVYSDLVAGKLSGGQPVPMAAVGAADDTGVATDAPKTTTIPTSESTTPPTEPGRTPDPVPTPTPITVQVNVTGVTLGYQTWYGTDNGQPVVYIVPTYDFTGTMSGNDSKPGPWSSSAIALDQAFIDSATPTPEPQPGGDPGVKPPVGGAPEPAPVPGTDQPIPNPEPAPAP